MYNIRFTRLCYLLTLLVVIVRVMSRVRVSLLTDPPAVGGVLDKPDQLDKEERNRTVAVETSGGKRRRG